MNKMFKNWKFWCFAGGVAAGIFARSQTARKACVNGIARGMLLKDSASETLQNMKEEAQDIYEDEKAKAAEQNAKAEDVIGKD